MTERPGFPTLRAVLRGALRSLWEEPRVPEPGGRPWWDGVLVAVLVPTAVAEGVLGTDVPWPPCPRP